MRTCTRLRRSVRHTSAKSHYGFRNSKQENPRRDKPRQVQHPIITRSRDVSVARCASDGAAALGQESQCPSTSAALLSPSELHPRIRLASVETALQWPAVHRCKVISVLSVLVTWERRWPQTSPPPGDG